MSSDNPDALERVTRDLADSKGVHDRFVEKLDRNERAYLAKFKSLQDTPEWMSQLRPPWVKHIVETSLAALIDDKIAFKIRPKPKMFEPGEYAKAKAGAKAHQILMTNQLSQDHFSEIQRPFVLQNQLASLTVAKTLWKREIVPRKKMVVENIPIIDPTTGMPITFFPKLVEKENMEPLYEGPTTEVVNVRDFFWHEAAISQEKSRFFIHRIWMTKDELKKLSKRGIYKNVEDITDPKGAQTDPEPATHNPRNRTRDMVEVVEHWDNERRVVTTIGDGKVILREMKYPYWHESHPFVICSTQPYPFQLDSMSQVETLADLQESLWDLENQTHDNVRLLNNAITIVRSHFDTSALDYAPGAFWPVEDPSEVSPWTPNPLPAEIAIGRTSSIKQDMQNLGGGSPFTSTSQARGIGADTATEAALVTSIAQLATKQMKTQINYALERIGQQRLELNKQFIRKSIYVDQIGIDGQREAMEILPEMLQGEYAFDVSPMTESLMRQERRSETQGFMQMLGQIAPIAAANGVVFNWKAISEDVFDVWDIPDPERYIMEQPPQGQAPPPGPQQQGQMPQPTNGITGPGSISSDVSPSHQASLSPARHLQRTLAQTGSGQ